MEKNEIELAFELTFRTSISTMDSGRKHIALVSFAMGYLCCSIELENSNRRIEILGMCNQIIHEAERL